jgi:phosphoadenosine phosphosulfate reductase|tara:strand:+ start:44539 stop:45153 length:615 start_codon:yes stop_codon:yes gene_type:complete
MPELNQELQSLSSEAIVRWAAERGEPMIASTSFGPNSAAMLHLISQAAPDLPIIWVDSGYNMRDTYVVAEEIMERLKLNMKIYVPSVTSERLNVLMGGIPTLDEPEKHAEFTRIVKLDPFEKAIKDLAPKLWISGIRQTDTNFRRNLDVLSVDGRGIVKVAPIFRWTDEDLANYMALHDLPSCRHYFDPTKVESGRECGLHTAA